MSGTMEMLPEGPLGEYRKQSNFNWKAMKMVFQDEESLKIKMEVWKTLIDDPIFSSEKIVATTAEQQKIAAKRLHRYLQFQFHSSTRNSGISKKKTLKLMMIFNEALAMAFPEISVKHAIGVCVVRTTLSTLGTERHMKILDEVCNGKVVGCVALTEIAHGSDTRLMKTTANFDRTTGEFIMRSPDFQSAKCWSGNLGKTATLAIVFAQLMIDSKCYGLHAFIVPIRCPRTLIPYPGVIIGDMGEKIGLHGVDNGFMIFDNYRIPRVSLLNRTGDVTESGEYESRFSEPGKILRAALENLSLVRVGLIQNSADSLIITATIAVRYAAVRRQFSEDGKSEIPIIEYQLHQWRIFPIVASAIAIKLFIESFTTQYLDALERSETSNNLDEINSIVPEIHAIISAAKPVITWTTRDAIQECREACGGHGYLKLSGLGDLRSANDATVTYEGDNNVLQQQASNWLVKQWTLVKQQQKVASPLATVSFFENFEEVFSRRHHKDHVIDIKYIIRCYEWLVIYLVKEVEYQMELLVNRGFSRFIARSKVQVYRSRVLSRVYAEMNVLKHVLKKIQILPEDQRGVLEPFVSLYGLMNLNEHISYFYQGGFCDGPSMATSIKELILTLCDQVKPNVVSTIDALAPPDQIVNSILGHADGKVYERLEEHLMKNITDRPEWWQEVIFADAKDPHLKSKL